MPAECVPQFGDGVAAPHDDAWVVLRTIPTHFRGPVSAKLLFGP